MIRFKSIVPGGPLHNNLFLITIRSIKISIGFFLVYTKFFLNSFPLFDNKDYKIIKETFTNPLKNFTYKEKKGNIIGSECIAVMMNRYLVEIG